MTPEQERRLIVEWREIVARFRVAERNAFQKFAEIMEREGHIPAISPTGGQD